MAAPSTQPKTSLGSTVRLSDGTGTPVTLTLPFYRGDGVLPELGEYLNELVPIVAQGQVVGVTHGAPTMPEFTCSFWIGNLVGSDDTAPGSLLEFITRKLSYDANVPTLGANRRSTVDVRLTILGTAWGDANNETVDLEDCVGTAQPTTAMDGNVLNCKFKCLGNIVITNGSGVATFAQATA